MKPNVYEAEQALKTKPIYSTAYERVKLLNDVMHAYDDLPQPLKFSRTLAYLLENVSVPVKEYDLIVGRAVDKELNAEEEKLFQAFIADNGNAYRSGAFFGSGHSSYDWEYIVELGVGGMKSRAISRLSTENDDAKRAFLQGAVEVYDAISSYILRFANSAKQAGLAAQAARLEKVAFSAPETFAEALQLVWIIALIDCAYVTLNPTLTLGRPDVFLYPFYSRDIASGSLTREEAKELITDYYCKHNLIMGRGEHQLGDDKNSTTFDRITNFDAPQYLLLAGTDEKGESAVNELTELFAECIVPSFKNPVVVVRYFIGMDKRHERLWNILTSKALQSSSMMFYNDNDVIAVLKRMGVTEGVHDYIHFGCNWASTGNNGAWMWGGPSSFAFTPEMSEEDKKYLRRAYMRYPVDMGWEGIFNAALYQLADENLQSGVMDRLFELFMAGVKDFISQKISYLSRELTVRQKNPSRLLVLTDCFLRESIDSAECYAASAKYHFEASSFQMFANVVDSFVAVDELVIRKKSVTLKELAKAVKNDFKDNERLRLACKNAEKFGSDGEVSNAYAKKLITAFTDYVFEVSKPYFEKQGLFLMPSLEGDTWHIKCGRESGASVDGRRAGEPFAQNARPSNGSCKNGLTGMFNSLLSVPGGSVASGALNVDVDSRAFSGEEGLKNFSNLLATYFNAGGLHAQVSCVSRDDLLAAQSDPDSYRDLRVRVTGYSGVFVDLCRELQDDVIARMDP